MRAPAGDEDSPQSAGGPAAWQVNLIIVLAVLALLHTFLLAVWMAPSSQARDSLGGSSLSSYVNPYFTQSWTTLIPSSQEVDEAFLVRARISGKTTPTTTAWIDVTADEHESGLGHSTWPRAHMAARRLATNMNAALLMLPGDGRDVVGDDHAQSPGDKVSAGLSQAGTAPPAIGTYLRAEQMAVRYASLYAHARWGSDVDAVQIRIGIRSVPERGNDEMPAASDMEWTTIGWRPRYRGTVEARQAFTAFVRR